MVSSSGIELIEAQGRIWSISYTYIIKMCLKCAIELGIPAVIHGHSPGPTSLPALAAALQLHPSKHDALRRLMRLLAHAGIFKLKEASATTGVNYFHTPASELLTGANPEIKAPPPPEHLFLDVDGNAATFWNSLGAWFRSSDGPNTAFEAACRMSMWELLADDDVTEKQRFYDAMAGDSKLVARVMVSDHCKEVFQGVESLLDVGGGTGIMSVAIAKAFPEIKCTVLDLPHVVPNPEEAKSFGLSNLEIVGGSMFGKIPAAADAILLKWVLHNWDDENCVKILKNCREAVSHGKKKKGKVILIDMVVGNGDKDFLQVQLCSDLLMMTLLNGKERTEAEFNDLFTAAGFSGYKIVRDLGPRSIIEAYP